MKIEKHIGIFEGVVSKESCQKIIEMFDFWKARNHTHLRENKVAADDEQLFLDADNSEKIDLLLNGEVGNVVLPALGECYAAYCEKYAMLQNALPHTFFQAKLQKTKPSQGYHIWHYENDGAHNAHRLTAFMLYLNDVEEGGETEFLYESIRVKPKAGTMLIFPVSYTHTHRGNPPLTGDKFVITGWSEFR